VNEQTTQKLTARLAAEQAGSRLPSVTAGLARNGELIWSAGRGLVGGKQPDSDVQYRAGSITKSFVAAAVLRLRDQGRLSLNDRISQFVPAGSAADVTVGQLLSQTSGLRAETAGPWWERIAGGSFAELTTRSLGPDAERWRPGRKYHYSNVGYALLGQLLASQHGKSWYEVVAHELLTPLGMHRTTLRPVPPHASGFAVHPHADLLLAEPEHDAGAMAPAGQLWSTVADLARWGAFLTGQRGDMLSKDTLAEMREPACIDDVPGEPWTLGYGLGLQLWNVRGVRLYGHSGSMPGFIGALLIAQDGTAAIVLTNSTDGSSLRVAPDLLEILAEGEPASQAEWSPRHVPAGVREMLGTWYWGPAAFTLSHHDGLLHLTHTRSGGSVRFRLASETGVWAGLDGYHAGEPLTLVTGDDDFVPVLHLGSFVYTRTPYEAAAPVPGGVDPAGWTVPE
jgi:CubicO group peptidase (beta-lactamase class C family)